MDVAGFVERRSDPSDRRGALINLTDAGRAAIDAVILSHIEQEHELLQGLEAEEQELLAMLLRKPLLSVGDHAAPDR
jgi:DNA-binding MarR family transcriptional regulator